MSLGCGNGGDMGKLGSKFEGARSEILGLAKQEGDRRCNALHR